MQCNIDVVEGNLLLSDPHRLLRGRHHSQMSVWGFRFDPKSNTYAGTKDDPQLLEKVSGYLTRSNVVFELSAGASALNVELRAQQGQLQRALREGARFKNADLAADELRPFLDFLASLPRKLKTHQVKAAIHLLAVQNGANFSVPGSGKTTVILCVFEWLRRLGEVNTLFIVGPPSCFGPWRHEYAAVIGREADFEILAGGNIEQRQLHYYPSAGDVRDIYLTSFQTLQRDCNLVKSLFKAKDVKAALVIDEAHYIKQLAGTWADAVLTISPFAKVRFLLTGTPFPQSFADAYNYFDTLWPSYSPIGQTERLRINGYIQKKQERQGGELLNQCIGPLFYRVRKSELCLAPQDFASPRIVHMNPQERRIYDAIVAKIRAAALNDDFADFELVTRLRQGRMMRLRQCISYSKLLGTAVTQYDENLLPDSPSLNSAIARYDELEVPAKLDATLDLVKALRLEGQKVLIWSNFVGTLKLLKSAIKKAGHHVELIYGGTPVQGNEDLDELTREKIIQDFKTAGGIEVLVANPAACAESISLHTACSNAIYYDLSYNCAQYLQSLDRIHRVGGSENTIAHYHFLQYADTIDQDILESLRRKADNMSAVIDEECPVYSLDMFSPEDELAAYVRLFG